MKRRSVSRFIAESLLRWFSALVLWGGLVLCFPGVGFELHSDTLFWRVMKSNSRLISFTLATCLGAAAPGLVSCGPPCPIGTPQAEARWEAAVDKMRIIPLDEKSDITIKRDVHNIVIGAEAGEVANAFQDVMRDPDLHFGLIKLRRKRENVNQPFKQGERFQGHYSVPLAATEWPEFWREAFQDLYKHRVVQTVVCDIENGFTSDFGELTKLELNPPRGEPYLMQYKYLGMEGKGGGSPIAGSSTFIVTPIYDVKELQRLGVSQASQLTQIFEYQEQSESFAFFFSTGGLRLHNQVVWSQATQAAKRIGAKILDSDIPKEYQK